MRAGICDSRMGSHFYIYKENFFQPDFYKKSHKNNVVFPQISAKNKKNKKNKSYRKGRNIHKDFHHTVLKNKTKGR